MRSRPIFLCLTALVIASSIARAETRSFKEHNFSIEIPAGWTETNAPAPALFAAKNTGGQKVFVAMTAPVPEKERPTMARDMARGAKSASKEKGWKISSEKQITVNGIRFETFNSQTREGATLVTWMTSAGAEAYSLQVISKTGDAGSDPELQSILNSFHLISAVPADTAQTDKESLAYKAGYLFGCCLTLGVFAAAVAGLIIWLRRRNKPKPTQTQ